MESRLSVITLAADDLGTMREFYSEKIGWKPIPENQDIVFYKMNGFLLSICKKKDLVGFIGIALEGNGFRPLLWVIMFLPKKKLTNCMNGSKPMA